MPYSTYVPSEDLDRPQRNALQRALEAMTPPGLVQQGTMLQERFDALGPVRVAERTADDLSGLFGRLGPISPLDVLSPARLGARAGAAAGRAAAESEAGVEAELRAGETLARTGRAAAGVPDTLTAGLTSASGLPGAAREGYEGFQQGRRGLLGADAQDIGGALGTGLEGLREFSRGQQEAQRRSDVGFSETMNRAAQRGGYEDVITPEQTKWYREAGENLAGAGPTGNTRNVVDDALGAVGGVVRGGINRLGRRVGRAARTEYGEAARVVPPGVARRLPGGVRLPDDTLFREAVENTPGASIGRDGLRVDVERFQKPGQAGGPADRVFYMAGDASQYADQAAFGGTERIAGPTLFQRPYVVYGETGGQAIGRAADALLGARAASDMRYPAQRIAQTLRYDGTDAERVAGWLTEYGGDPGSAEAIVRGALSDANHADHASRLMNGLMENVIAAELRRQDFDGLVGVGGRGRFHLTEVMDVRERQFPGPAGQFGLRPELQAALGPGEDVLGIRRGQRLRQPPLTPEQQVQRAADGAAEQRVFDAIRALWRRGPAGEEIADELRFLSVGKGEAGEAAARELLTSRGLEDVLPPPTAAGVVAETPVAGEGVLGLARRATEPLGAAAARTPGERAFDLASGTAGGVVGAATAEEDATWQERVSRGALGASLGALGGANLRQLGRVARGALGTGDEALGAVPRSAQTHPEAYPSATGVERQGALPGFREPPQIGPIYRPPGATYPGTRAPAPRPPEPVVAPVDDAAAAGRSRWGVAADVATSAPLLRPTSLLGNAASGGFRTLQRLAEESGGALLTSAPAGALRESVDDLVGMVQALPGAVRAFGPSVRTGGTAATQRQLGAEGGSLVTRPGLRAGLATAGTRLNIATDEFWRQVNRGGAEARAAARGITDPNDVAELSGQAADFVSFAGKASRLADHLGSYRRFLDDPNASGLQKAGAAFLTSLTPYVKTPERVLMATGRLLGDLPGLPLSALQKNSLVREAMRGNQEAKREVAGRLLVSGLTYVAGTLAYANGSLYGAPPKDAKLRRRMEAEGAQWNTVAGVPTRFLGNFGQAMAGLGTALLDAQQAAGKGADPTDIARTFVGSAARWALDESFLRGLSDLDEAVREGRGGQFAEESAVDAATRPLSGLAGFVDPFDPLERERRGTRDALVGALPGGRFALPARLDPATGEPLRREGSGVERLFLGSRGVAESPEARELARLGLTAREFKPQDTVYGNVQTPEARRVLQETFGRSTRDYIRDTMARPDYQGATQEEQAATLRRQIGLAQKLADLEVGDRVARDPQARYELEWLRTPHYQGVTGAPDAVARRNLEISEAKQLLSEYRQRYGTGAGTDRLYREDRKALELAMTPEIPAAYLAEQQAKLRQRLGAPDARGAALPGAGNRVLPPSATPSFTAP